MIRRRRAPGAADALRPRLAAGGLLVAAAVAVTGILLGGAPAQAADPGVVAAVAPPEDAAPVGTTATVTVGGATLRVAVSPDDGLPPSGAQITVAGTGFDPEHDLWIAVCEDDGVAPAALLHCVGGPIPDQNASTGWGIVTDAKQSPYPGPVTAKWKKDGSFELTLQLPSAMSEDADCVSAPCSVYTRSSVDTDRSQDVRVRVGFAAPPVESNSEPTTTSSSTEQTSSSTSSAEPTTSSVEPSTETIGVVPTTVSPEIMVQTSAAVGSEQTVLFAGFTPGEKVDVTLYSEPVTLPTATADPTGNVRITFAVPETLEPGEHLLQAVGRESGRVGIARFTVGAAPSSTVSETASAAVSPTASAVGSPTSAAQSEVVSALPSQVVSSAPISTGVVSPSMTETVAASSSSAAAGAGEGGGNRLLWLWIVLAVLVIVGGAAGIVAMVRNRRETEDELPTVQADQPPAPGWSAGGRAPGTATGPTAVMPPASIDPGGFGLLSGRDHPDGPVLYSGGEWPDRPTSVIGNPPQQPGQPGPEAPTQQWRPDFGAPATPTQPSPPTPTGPTPTGPTPSAPPAPTGPTATGPTPAAPPTPTGPTRAGQGAPDDGGPSTQQWRPDFTGETPAAGDETPGAPSQPGPDDEQGDSAGRHRGD